MADLSLVEEWPDDDDDEAVYSDGPVCDLCGNWRGFYDEYRSCENCNLTLCRKCWGPTVCDDLYVGWCNSCAG